MTERVIEVEADSLEEARVQVWSQIPKGLVLLSEEIVSDGKPKTVRAVADSTEAAFTKAQGEIPNSANILGRKELSAPVRKVITVETFDEQGAESSAGLQARQQLGSAAIVKSVKLVTPGKKGFLGIGAKPCLYEAELLQQAVVEVTYKPKARVSVKVGNVHDVESMLQQVIAERTQIATVHVTWKPAIPSKPEKEKAKEEAAEGITAKNDISGSCDLCSVAMPPSGGIVTSRAMKALLMAGFDPWQVSGPVQYILGQIGKHDVSGSEIMKKQILNEELGDFGVCPDCIKRVLGHRA